MPPDTRFRSVEKRDELILEWEKLVFWCWGRFRHCFPISVLTRDEAISAGYLGLLRAAEMWVQDDREFDRYAIQAIKNSMRKDGEKKKKSRMVYFSEIKPDHKSKWEPEDPTSDHQSRMDAIDACQVALRSIKSRRARELVRLMMEGKRFFEIADAWGVTNQAVGGMFHRIRKEMMSAIDAEGRPSMSENATPGWERESSDRRARELNQTPLTIVYRNWRGETAVRKILPLSVFFGTNEWHQTPQWLMRAHDVERNAERTFALRGILKIE